MKQAMIFAAGLGTRLRPLTDSMPKALVRVGGQPLLWHVLMQLKAAGFERVVVNVHHFADQIKSYLASGADFGLDILVSDESGQLLETGGGVRHARHFFDPDSPILIHNVDILSNANLPELYSRALSDDALLLVSQRESKRYLLFDDDMLLVGWTNVEMGQVKSPRPLGDISKLHRYAFSGIHVISPQLLQLTEERPERFGIIDFYLSACASHRLRGVVQPGLRLLDVGKQETLRQAEDFIKTAG